LGKTLLAVPREIAGAQAGSCGDIAPTCEKGVAVQEEL